MPLQSMVGRWKLGIISGREIQCPQNATDCQTFARMHKCLLANKRREYLTKARRYVYVRWALSDYETMPLNWDICTASSAHKRTDKHTREEMTTNGSLIFSSIFNVFRISHQIAECIKTNKEEWSKKIDEMETLRRCWTWRKRWSHFSL